ncbi:MAG TPA: hypothetical protein VMD27_13025 [Candidatus Aquilonibacter sp.]|nr:hypothetical protein [Candidatus Aquilonibacter sp.]
MKTAPHLRYLLGHHEPKKITMDGIILKLPGKLVCQYWSEELPPLIGQFVQTWFDPTRPEALIIEDMDGKNPRPIPRVNTTADAFEATTEEFQEASKVTRGYGAFSRMLYRQVSAEVERPARPLIIDPVADARGRQLEEQTQELAETELRRQTTIRRESSRRRQSEQTVRDFLTESTE